MQPRFFAAAATSLSLLVALGASSPLSPLAERQEAATKGLNFGLECWGSESTCGAANICLWWCPTNWACGRTRGYTCVSRPSKGSPVTITVEPSRDKPQPLTTSIHWGKRMPVPMPTNAVEDPPTRENKDWSMDTLELAFPLATVFPDDGESPPAAPTDVDVDADAETDLDLPVSTDRPWTLTYKLTFSRTLTPIQKTMPVGITIPTAEGGVISEGVPIWTEGGKPKGGWPAPTPPPNRPVVEREEGLE